MIIDLDRPTDEPPGRRPRRAGRSGRALIVATAAAVLLVGYLVLHHGSGPTPSAVTATPNAAETFVAPVVPTGQRCFDVIPRPDGGNDLLLGVQIRNRSPYLLALTGGSADSFHTQGNTDAALGTCDQLAAGTPGTANTTEPAFASGSTAWYTVRLRLRGNDTKCPDSTAAWFEVSYKLDGMQLPSDAGIVLAPCPARPHTHGLWVER